MGPCPLPFPFVAGEFPSYGVPSTVQASDVGRPHRGRQKNHTRPKISNIARTPKTAPRAMERFFLRGPAEVSVDEVADATIRSVVVKEAPDDEDVDEDDAGLMTVYLHMPPNQPDK